VLYGEPDLKEEALGSAEEVFGPVLLRQPPFPFDHTDYYAPEMGAPLYKQLVVFERLLPPADLAETKLITNHLEAGFTRGNRRRVNLDPGLLELGRVVLASTKDCAHRIYLGKGIFGEVTLLYQKGSYQPLPWTYSDWRSPENLSFLNSARVWYLKKLADAGGSEE
jgi:hypothetical protein